jgi:hypothetical protein
VPFALWQERCRQKLDDIALEHEVAKEDLEREIAAKTKAMRFKSSSKLLQLEDVERRLALAKAP